MARPKWLLVCFAGPTCELKSHIRPPAYLTEHCSWSLGSFETRSFERRRGGKWGRRLIYWSRLILGSRVEFKVELAANSGKLVRFLSAFLDVRLV